MTAATLDPPRTFGRVTAPGLALANAWLNVALASSDDENRPILWRSVLVETFKTGLQLIATDSYLLLGCYVPFPRHDLTPPPGLDEKPNETVIAVDPAGRMTSLMRHVHKEAVKAEEAGEDYEVRLAARSIESTATPTLDPSLDRLRFTVQTDDERLSLPIYEAEYPNWRSLVAKPNTVATEDVALSIDILARLGRIRGASHLQFTFDGPLGLTRIETPGSESYLFGGLIPVRAGA